MSKLSRRLGALFARSRWERDLDEEMQLHVDRLVARLRAEGVDEMEARRRARLEFGGVQQLREEARDARGLGLLEDLGRDLRLGWRALCRQPGLLIMVSLTLCVGVGGSAAIFGAVNGVLLEPLPYPDADRLVSVWQHDRESGSDLLEVAPGNFLDWRERVSTFERLTAMEPYGLDWNSPDGPIYLTTWLVYEGFFDVFRTPPLLGRTFRLDEHVVGRGDVVVLGHDLWRSRFAGAPDVLGRVLTLDGRPHTVVGVMPEGFAIPSDDVVWAPKVLEGWEEESRNSAFYSVFGRLRDGVALSEASADLDTIADQLSREYPSTNALVGISAIPLREQIVGRIRTALWLLFGAVALVLVVVTASVASMQLARAVARGPEFAVRATLGAGPGRVARQLLAENLIVAGVGTGLGFGLALLALNGIRALAPADLPRVTQLRADTDVLMFAASLSILAVFGTGIVPVLFAARAPLSAAAAHGGRAIGGSRLLARFQASLVVVQCCASLILLVGAGLLLRSFVAVVSEPAGFRTDGVATVTVQSWSYYTEGPARAAFVREVTDRLASMPGIRAGGMTSSVPLMESIGADEAPMAIEGAPPPAGGQALPLIHYTVATRGLFSALAIPLRAGRLFDDRDDANGVPVALINETLARRYFPDGDAVGRRISLGGSAARLGGTGSREIVGVVGDLRRIALHEAPRPGAFIPHAQLPTGANAIVAWGDGSVTELTRQVRETIWEVNPSIPVYRERTMADLVGSSLRQRRFLLVLLAGFAGMALMLAAAGIYGLMTYVTAQRTREYGLRIALGALRGELVSLVLTRGLVLATGGTALGVLGALALTRLLAGLLYGVTPLDPLTFALATGVLCATAVAASFYPAWRAATIDPIEALRE